MKGLRKIIHVDMDCFYAAIECRDDPSVAHLPVGVGGDGGRGVLTTCNYVAREFGCRSAMPVFKAVQLCPHLIMKPVRFDVYRKESQRIRAIFRDYTDKIEPLSLDEAYLDVTELKSFAWDIAKEIRRRIKRETGLTASAGVSFNKMLAKIASDWNKPDGQHAVLPEGVDDFLRELPIRKIPGIGAKGEALLHEKGIRTCGELQGVDRMDLGKWFGPSWSEELWMRCRGIDDREVETSRERKSMSVERTFSSNLNSVEDCLRELESVFAELVSDLKKKSLEENFYKVFLKLKFANFQSTTKEVIASELSIERVSELLMEAFARSPHAVRLIGLGVKFREKDQRQLEMEF